MLANKVPKTVMTFTSLQTCIHFYILRFKLLRLSFECFKYKAIFISHYLSEYYMSSKYVQIYIILIITSKIHLH